MKLSVSKTTARRAVAGIILAPVVALVYLAASIVTYARKSDGTRAGAAIVLGAAVADGVPTLVFEQRILHAIALYEQGTVDRLIFTGGVGAGDDIAESEAARTYCLARGIPASALMIEAQSHSTEENLANAREVVVAQGVGRVLIVSDPLHERRAVTIARDLGLDAHPSPTPTTRYVGVRAQGYFLVRETYFYARYLAKRALGYNAAELAVAPDAAQPMPFGSASAVAPRR